MASSGRILTSADILDGSIVDADIAAGALIAASKLQNATPGHVVREVSAGAMGTGFVVTGNMVAGSIHGDRITAQTITGGSVGAGMHIGYQQVQGGSAGGNSNIAPGSIAVGDLAANAATAVAAINGVASYPTTISTSPVMVTDMTIPLTTVGGTVIVISSLRLSHSAVGAIAYTGIGYEGAWQGISERNQYTPAAGGEFTITTIFYVTPSAGTHSFQSMWATSSGTLTAVGAARTLIAFELRR